MCSIAVLIIVCGTLTTSLGCDKPKKKEHQAGSGQTTGVLATSKGKATPKKPAGPTRAGAVSVGTKVMAPYRGSAKRHPGTVTELYGKLAHINFDDGTRAWAMLTRLKPRGTALPDPRGKCWVHVGQPVQAPFGASKKRYTGRVSAVYGKLAYIRYSDGDRGWELCSECEPI